MSTPENENNDQLQWVRRSRLTYDSSGKCLLVGLRSGRRLKSHLGEVYATIPYIITAL